MGAVLQFEPYRQKSEVESWRQAGYAAVDQMIEKMSKEVEGKGFEELSELLRREGKSVTGAIFEEVLKSRGAKERLATTHVCEGCGRTLSRQPKLQSRTVESLHGEIEIERPYFYCKPCGKGFYPFDDALEIGPEKKQYDLQRAAAELFTEVPFERASQIFERLTGIKMSDHCQHEVAAKLGEVADVVRVLPSRQRVEEKIEQASQGRVWRPVLVVAADGAALPTRPQTKSRSHKRGPGEWKEAKGFRIYLVGQERIEQIMSWHQIATEEEFGEALRYAATLIPVESVRVALVGDGAKWVWTHLTAAFPTGKEIIDYYHCSEHVHQLAKVQFRNDDYQQVLWIESAMARLYFGEVESVIWGLQRMNPDSDEAAEEIRKLIGYLKNS
jgi:macrodomain Ter protein organizer (MatP/YcbG family)